MNIDKSTITAMIAQLQEALKSKNSADKLDDSVNSQTQAQTSQSTLNESPTNPNKALKRKSCQVEDSHTHALVQWSVDKKFSFVKVY